MVKKTSRTGRFALLLLLAICVGGCSSVPMPKGSSKAYSSARFIQPNKAGRLDGTEQSVEVNRMIKESIASQMEKHDLRIVEGNDADLIIAYLIVLQDNFSTTYINQYYGYQDFTEIVDLAHKKGMKGRYPEYVQKGALVIDLIDAKTFKLVYRDYAVRGRLSGLSEEERQARVSEAVTEALQKFFN